MPAYDHLLPVRIRHVPDEVFHTTNDTLNVSQHCLRYGPTEILGTREQTDETRDLTQERATRWPDLVPRTR